MDCSTGIILILALDVLQRRAHQEIELIAARTSLYSRDYFINGPVVGFVLEWRVIWAVEGFRWRWKRFYKRLELDWVELRRDNGCDQFVNVAFFLPLL